MKKVLVDLITCVTQISKKKALAVKFNIFALQAGSTYMGSEFTCFQKNRCISPLGIHYRQRA